MATPAGFLTGLQRWAPTQSLLEVFVVKQLLSSRMIYFQLQAASVNTVTDGESPEATFSRKVL